MVRGRVSYWRRERTWLSVSGALGPAFHVLAKPTGSACNLDCAYCFFLDKERLYPGVALAHERRGARALHPPAHRGAPHAAR